MLWGLAVAAFSASISAQYSATNKLTATVALPHPAAQATAAVFRRADGVMVRTLWHHTGPTT